MDKHKKEKTEKKESNNQEEQKLEIQNPADASGKPEEKHKKKSELDLLKEEKKQLNKELLELKEKNLKLNLEISKLENQIKQINSDYIQKVTQKAKEAQELVNKKHLELEEKSKLEVSRQVDRLIESKFDALLNAIEQLNKIIETPSENPEVKNYTYGFKMILGIIQNALNELGISQIVIEVGSEFNENVMQAFEMVDDKQVPSHHVAYVFSNAYKYKDTIIKHAVVKVQK